MLSIDDARQTVAASLTAHGVQTFVPRGEILFREGEPAGDVCVVVAGQFEVYTVDDRRDGSRVSLGSVGPGDVVGEISALLRGARSATVRAISPGEVRVVSREVFDSVLLSEAAVASALELIVRSRLRDNRHLAVTRQFLGDVSDDIMRTVLVRFTSMTIERGEFLFRQGDSGDSLYLLVSGVLEVLAEAAPPVTLAWIYRGEPVGEMALISDEPRTASVRAARTCELLRLSRSDFRGMIPENPELLMGVTRTLVDRLRNSRAGSTRRRTGRNVAVLRAASDAGFDGQQVSTQRIVAELYDAMPSGMAAHVLTSAHLSASFGDTVMADLNADVPRGLALDAWIEELESSYDILFLVADETSADISGWTRRCLSRADQVLVIADETVSAEPIGLEAAVYAEHDATSTATIDIVFVHRPETAMPTGTARRLRRRPVRSHFHVALGSAADMQRLARILTNRAVGVALGGGGARGVSHVGILQALEETGVPIDFISGTSMGAVVGALWAMRHGGEAILDRIEAIFVRHRPFREYTLPVYGLLRGRRIQRAAAETFAEFDLEDLWIPFVCTSTNLSRQQACAHRSGRIASAILASAAIPGVTIPRLLDGELHVDGGVLNNLPGDIIPSFCRRTIVCDVTPAPELRVDGDEFPSPIAAWRSQAPNIATILYAAMTVGSQAHSRSVRDRADVALQPPVAEYGLLDFQEMRAIHQLGYAHAMEDLKARLPEWWAR